MRTALSTTPTIRSALYVALAIASFAGGRTARAQRVQFPTMVSDPATFQGGVAPSYTPPPGSVYAPPGTTFSTTPPAGTIDGAIQPVNPGWDPYAAPTMAPATMAPAPTGAIYPPEGYMNPDGTLAQPQRLVDEIRFEYAFLNGNGSSELGIDDLFLSGTLAVPFLYNAAPLLVRPSFAVHYWDGPDSAANAGADMPPRTYDAVIEAAWKPVVTSWLSGDLRMSVGYYSDFKKYDTEAIRIRGQGLAIFTLSSRFAVVAGVDYINRLQIKLLPAGGVIWTPNPDTRWEILFPYPKLANRITTWGTTDVWLYVGGEYGGGTWSIQRTSLAEDAVDYNDLRVFVGTEFVGYTDLKGWFEVGFVWDRELVYLSGTPTFKPNETFMLRAGISY